MDLFQIEEFRRSLVQLIDSESSDNQKLLLINEFITILLNSNNKLAAHAYIPEFTDELVELLKSYSPFHKSPEYTSRLLDNMQKLIDSRIYNSHELITIYYRLRGEQEDYEKIFSGSFEETRRKRVYFPVIELFRSIGQRKIFGFLEYLQIEIFQADNEDTFIIVPSEQDLDRRLNDQIKISWDVALLSVKKYLPRIHKYHRIIIQFQSRKGFYIGDSLGTVLTVMFIKQLLLIYNSPYLIDISESLAITGGVDSDGNIIPVSDLIVRRKVETVFYSHINILVVPENDRAAAEDAAISLQQKYPARVKLKITGIRDLQDLFDRRSIIDIRKQNPVIRGSKFIKKNWISAALLTLLIIVFSYLFIIDLDDNPARVEHEGKILKVLNKNGRVLWTENVVFDSEFDYINGELIRLKLIDIDQDGINEVLISGAQIQNNTNDEFNLICYDYKKTVKWSIRFTDIITTNLEEHSSTYQICMIDTLTVDERKLMFLIARNVPFYPGAIFKIDLLTGERVDSADVFWHAGNLTGAKLNDFNNDGKAEIAAIAVSNCYEKGAAFSINIDQLRGQAPASGNYVIKDLPIAKMNAFVLLPKSDFCDYHNLRYPLPGGFLYDSNKNEFTFSSKEGPEGSLLYSFNSDLVVTKVSCCDALQVYRDELVRKGEISPPYTNTVEYFELIKNSVLYWDGNKFTKNYSFLN